MITSEVRVRMSRPDSMITVTVIAPNAKTKNAPDGEQEDSEIGVHLPHPR